MYRPLFVFIIGFPVDSANLQQHVVKLEQELQWARLKIQALTEELRLERIKRYGHKSETLSALQLELLDEEPGVTSEEVEAEARREPLPAARERGRKPHPGRQIFPEHLPRVEQVVACKDRTCQQCGGETTLIGYDESEHLDMEPVRFFVRVVKREKRGCRQCKTSGVVMAELAPRIVEKGIASDRVVVETVVAKYCDHLPLYRQKAMLQREAGLEISRATLTGWVMRIGELLQPLVGVMRKDLLGANYLQADETVVRCRCMTREEPIIRRTCGNTVGPVGRQYSTSGSAAAARGRTSSSISGKAFCRPTAIRLTIAWAGSGLCMWAAGRTRGASLSMR